jgi:hypothetical protein
MYSCRFFQGSVSANKSKQAEFAIIWSEEEFCMKRWEQWKPLKIEEKSQSDILELHNVLTEWAVQ